MFSLGTLGAFRLSLLTVKRMFQIYIKAYAEDILAEVCCAYRECNMKITLM